MPAASKLVAVVFKFTPTTSVSNFCFAPFESAIHSDALRNWARSPAKYRSPVSMKFQDAVSWKSCFLRFVSHKAHFSVGYECNPPVSEFQMGGTVPIARAVNELSNQSASSGYTDTC